MYTIKDIARELHLSPSTVSRALNGNPLISLKTRKKVAECARNHGYVPDRNARNLVTRSNRTVGFMIPDISDSFFSYSAAGVEEVLYRNGYEVVYCSTNRELGRVEEFLIRAQEYRYSGVFLTPDWWNEELIELVHKIGLPVVSLRRKTPQTTPEIPYVDSDHYGGCKEAAEYLIAQGHREIGLICMNTQIELERRQGYEDTVARHGLRPHIEFSPFSTNRIEIGFQAAKTMLEREPEISAIIATGDKQALGAMEYFDRAGLRTPEDISLIGCDDQAEGRVFSIQLSTVQQAVNELGIQAAEMMMRMIADPAYTPSSVILKSKLLLRRTTGPRKGAETVQRQVNGASSVE